MRRSLKRLSIEEPVQTVLTEYCHLDLYVIAEIYLEFAGRCVRDAKNHIERTLLDDA